MNRKILATGIMLVGLGIGCLSENGEEATESASSAIASPCGTPLNEVDGVWAYSNGWAEGTADSCVGRLPEGSLAYQCVEFAQRYSQKMHGTTLIWNVQVAAQMCTNNPAGTTVHWVGSGYQPRHGDIAVWTDNGYGHVAVVKTVRADGIEIVEQNGNWSANGTRVLTTASGWGGIDCFVSGKGSGGGGGGGGSTGPAGPCGFGTGDYCGGNGGGADLATLYHCEGKELSVVKTCAMGCAWMPDKQNDQCRTVATCPEGAGRYCGGHGISGDANVLFDCKPGKITPLQRCAKGCTPMAAGLHDQCAP